jgi:hypothetical protein
LKNTPLPKLALIVPGLVSVHACADANMPGKGAADPARYRCHNVADRYAREDLGGGSNRGVEVESGADVVGRDIDVVGARSACDRQRQTAEREPRHGRHEPLTCDLPRASSRRQLVSLPHE